GGGERFRPIRRKRRVLVQAVVNDFPAEPVGEVPGERRPERRLDQEHGFVDLETIARASERLERFVERRFLEPAVPRVLATSAGNRKKGDPGSDSGRPRRFPLAFERRVEDAVAAAREGLRELLGALSAVGP